MSLLTATLSILSKKFAVALIGFTGESKKLNRNLIDEDT